MKRDLELIREILEWLEEQDSPWAKRPEVPEDRRADVHAYHLSLCEQAKFIKIRRKRGKPQKVQLTWKGHEVLGKREENG